MNIFKRVGYAFVLGYILLYWSELLFWSFWRTDNSIAISILSWVLYSFFAYVILVVVHAYHIRSSWAYFLVGALFGWLDEGLYAMTMFGVPGFPFPVTISWTGLAWHALLSVWVGWFWMKQALTKDFRTTLCLSIGIGVFWGYWAVAWMLETPPLSATPLAFFTFAFVTTTLYALSHALLPRFARHSFEPSATEKIVCALVVLTFFLFVTVPLVPMAAVVLPLLCLFLWIAFRRNRQKEKPIEISMDRVPFSRVTTLACVVPVVATFSYLLCMPLNAVMRTNLSVLIVTTILGAVLCIVSWINVVRKA